MTAPDASRTVPAIDWACTTLGNRTMAAIIAAFVTWRIFEFLRSLAVTEINKQQGFRRPRIYA
jgi:hypothetical protein